MNRSDLALAGPMGAGKTTVGGRVAAWLDAAFTDLDQLVESREGRSIPALFARSEAVFRTAERRALQAWLDSKDRGPRVLALGGGTLEHPDLAAALKERAVVVHLDAPGAELAARLDAAARKDRPLLAATADPAGCLEEVRRRRASGYAEADFTFSSSGFSAAATAVGVLRRLYHPAEGPWRTSPAFLAPGISTGRGGCPFPSAKAAVLLWDKNLPAVHAAALLRYLSEKAGGRLLVVQREGGEGAKTPASLWGAWEELAREDLDRTAPVWVAGGGTLTDLGGLLAHTYKRGLDLHLLPTTLVGQLDAALGGKNALNLGPAKNLLGTIRLPAAVHIDPLFLLTLPPRELRAGIAEAVKCALIGDPELLDLLEAGAAEIPTRPLAFWEEVTRRAARVKLDLVARDLEERGERRLLNLGHTLGHALEWALRHREEPLNHGEAVAAGLVFALRLSRRLGFLRQAALEERVIGLLTRWGLPAAVPALTDKEKPVLRQALAQDKKRTAGQGTWILPLHAGCCRPRPVREEDVFAELSSCRD